MSLSNATIRSRVYGRTGLTSSEMAESVVDSGIASALTEFARHKINTKFGTIAVLENVVDYPFPEGVSEIIDLVYDTGSGGGMVTGTRSFEDLLMIDSGFGSLSTAFGGDAFDNPGMVMAWWSKVKEFRDNFGGGGWRILDGNPRKIHLDTVPGQDATAYYEGSIGWTLGNILPQDEETFLKFVMWKACEARAMRLAVVTAVSDGTGISVQPAFKFWNDKSAEFKADALGEVGACGGSMMVG